MGLFSRLRRTPDPPDRVLVVSDGLAAHGQQEIAVAVRLRPRESAAEVRAQLERLLGLVEELAQQGRLVHEGGFTEFGESGFLSSRTRGLIYADARGLDPEIPDDALLAVLVDLEELRLARSTSTARVLARLGAQASEYPFPVTCDRDRPSVARPGDDASVLTKVARVTIPEMSVSLANDVVTLRCRPGARARLEHAFEQLPDDAGFALLTRPEPTASGRLVWFPEQAGPAAITPPGGDGERLSGTMLLVAAGGDEDRISVLEDGFAMLARASTWTRVREALLAGDELELPPSEDGPGLRVVQLEDGWNTYEPAGGARGREQVVLLTPESKLAAAVSIELLSAYLNGLIAGLGPVDGVAVRVILEPGAEPQLAYQGVIPEEVLDALAGVEAPAVRGQVAFEIRKPAMDQVR